MDVKTPSKIITEVQQTLQSKRCTHQKVFLLQNIESLAGKLGQIASTALLLYVLLLDLYALIAQYL